MNKYRDEINKLALEMIALAFAIEAKTDYCIFIDYMGHTEHLRIDIAKSMDCFDEKIVTTSFRLVGYTHADQNDYDCILEQIKQKRDTLKQIADDGEIDTSDMNEVVQSTYSHSF